jgi:hypothetical protein
LVGEQVLAGPPLQPASPQQSHSAGVVLAAERGRTAKIDIPQGVTFDEYPLQLASLSRGEPSHVSAGREQGIGEIGIDQTSPDETVADELSIHTTHVVGISLTVVPIWWALRVSGLLASLLASLPAWRQLDLLLILPDDEERTRRWGQDDDEEAVRDEDAVSDLLVVTGEEEVRQ